MFVRNVSKMRVRFRNFSVTYVNYSFLKFFFLKTDKINFYNIWFFICSKLLNMFLWNVVSKIRIYFRNICVTYLNCSCLKKCNFFKFDFYNIWFLVILENILVGIAEKGRILQNYNKDKPYWFDKTSSNINF